ncbi:16S rRNA (cytidine(1402)-2'-O)-methyltransferase [Candidatus Calescamantes bacterium]|nr:16S rRNA (cytidine(1402)-2'-O)-methyltransferase [Candidatus Calescamantes bacterium]
MGEGTLYLVSTPIGNLKDITFRALEVLRESDLILAEDTRTTRKLLTHYQIKGKRLLSFYSYNAKSRIPQIIHYLKEGKNLALVSEAGTPGISDPGYILVKRAIEEGIDVKPIPGASAFLSALIISGLPTQEFHFGGFLPSTGKMRRRKLKKIKDCHATLVFYVSPHRIEKSLQDIKKILGNRRMALVREVTKVFEEIIRGKIDEILEVLEKNPEKKKGEMVLVISEESDKEEELGKRQIFSGEI